MRGYSYCTPEHFWDSLLGSWGRRGFDSVALRVSFSGESHIISLSNNYNKFCRLVCDSCSCTVSDLRLYMGLGLQGRLKTGVGTQ